MSNQNQPKTILITGASSGIGLGVAKAYVERGDNVVLNGRNESKLNEAADQLALILMELMGRPTAVEVDALLLQRTG